MKTLSKGFIAIPLFIFLALTLIPKAAFAQTDEIQVYDAEIEDPGVFNIMVHNNFTPIGRKSPDFPGAIIPNDSDNGAVEWAYGMTPWFEQGLYFPVYSAFSKGRDGSLNGFKVRELFVRPRAHDHTFFYGINFEFSWNYPYWEDRRNSAEMRPIVGVHFHKWDFIYNPIMDTNWTGGPGNLEFVPAGRIAYNIVPDKWAVAVEQYSDFGTWKQFLPANDQFQEVWATFDHNSKYINIEAGVGVGVTSGADKLTFKLMLSRDINADHPHLLFRRYAHAGDAQP
jgi:hypothetical protein